MLDGLKRHATLRSLDMYRQNAFHLPDFQLERDRFVIFSDAHKGDKRQTLDEFQHNEELYCHALNHYLNDDFGLILNGDMEEGWKNRYSRIMASYEHSVYALERGFAEQGVTRHLRIWGNHDNDWQNKMLVDKYLGGVLRQPVRVHPAVVLGNRIMIAHGHQGSPDAEHFARFSRMAVRYIWRHLQSLLDLERKVTLDCNPIWQGREHYLYEWAKSRRMLMIAGHTHRPTLSTLSPLAYLTALHENLIRQIENTVDLNWRTVLSALLDVLDRVMETAEFIKTTANAIPQIVPCYVNSGSLLSQDGITGIELDRGEIRLVQWHRSETGFARTIHQQGNLSRMLASF